MIDLSAPKQLPTKGATTANGPDESLQSCFCRDRRRVAVSFRRGGSDPRAELIQSKAINKMTVGYPVEGRSELTNRRIGVHEAGHALVTKAIGDTVWSVGIIPCRFGPHTYEGRCVRSGPPSDLALSGNEDAIDKAEEIVSICERLERLTPEIGSQRVDSSEFYIRSQNNAIALVAGECAEMILHPDLPSLGANHDHVEALAFARIAVTAQPAVKALLDYCRAEATAILSENRDILAALVEALIEFGELSGGHVDQIISQGIVARSQKCERERRADWRRREISSAEFLKGLGT